MRLTIDMRARNKRYYVVHAGQVINSILTQRSHTLSCESKKTKQKKQ